VVLLRRKAEWVDKRLRRANRRPGLLETADRLGVTLLQLFACPADPVEERPPDRLRLAPVVKQKLREQPARPVGFLDVVRIVGQACEQCRTQLLGFCRALGRVARLLLL
jgi:hypothetical protein